MLECIPNISEGRNRETIDAAADAVRSTHGVYLLNLHSDEDHNRSVLTYASNDPEALIEATSRLFEVAVSRIDLNRHQGAHPRVGAVDVVPFVPLEGSTMADAIDAAGRTARMIGERFRIPVYLYEESASLDYRRDLPAIRSGGFENFSVRMSDPHWRPDFGPLFLHQTAGVSVVGARLPLIAFNMQLDTDRIEVARDCARAVRTISGGLPKVRALPIALTSRAIVQVSMNLLDYHRTPIHEAFSVVREEAERQGVNILSSEIVGLVPAEALYQVAEWHLRMGGFRTDIVLEERIKLVTSKRAS